MTTNQAILVWQLVPFLTDISVSTILLNRATLFNLQVTGSASFVHSFGSKRRPLKFFAIVTSRFRSLPKSHYVSLLPVVKGQPGSKILTRRPNVSKIQHIQGNILLFLASFETNLFHNFPPRIQEGTSIDIPWMWNRTHKLHYFGTVNSCRRRSEKVEKRKWNSRRKIYDKWIKG